MMHGSELTQIHVMMIIDFYHWKLFCEGCEESHNKRRMGEKT